MRRITFLLGLIFGYTVSSFSQIEGDVMDQKDKGIPNALIIATDTTGKIADTAKSDNRGFYFFTNLKPGKYKIEVKVSGFQPSVFENIIVKEDETGVASEEDLFNGQRLDITMTPVKIPK